MTMMMGGAGFKLDYRDYRRKATAMLGVFNQKLTQNIARKTAFDAARETAWIAKRIVADEVSDSGRLAASIGPYEPGFLRRKGTGSTAADSIWEKSEKRNVFTVEYGTNVSYAVPIFLGFTMSETRVVYLPEENRFITVHPFSFLGIHALERADAEFQADPNLLKRIFEDNSRELVVSWNKAQ